jgi:hypothetical protein
MELWMLCCALPVDAAAAAAEHIAMAMTTSGSNRSNNLQGLHGLVCCL